MARAPTDQGQRVNEPSTVSGDAPAGGEPDPTEMKEAMASAAQGSDAQLKEKENQAEQDLSAIKPDHREGDAGQ